MIIKAQVAKPAVNSKVDWNKAAILLCLGVILYLVIGPLVMLFVASIKSTGINLPLQETSWTLQNFISIYGDPDTYQVLLNTLYFSLGSLMVGFTTSVILTLLIERTKMPCRNLLFTAIIIPLAVPGLLSAISWVMLLNPSNGIINVIIRDIFGLQGLGPFNIYSLPGMWFIEGLRVVPTTFLMMSGAFQRMDPSLEEQSMMAGESVFGTMRKITLPLLQPAIIAALIFYAIVTVEAFDVPGIIGPTAGLYVFSTKIFFLTHPVTGLPDYGSASALALSILVISLFLITLYRHLTKDSKKFATITGKGYRPSRMELGNWKYLGLFIAFGYVLFAVVLPVLVLIWSSLHSFFVPLSWEAFTKITFQPYQSLFAYPGIGKSLTNTFIISLVTATATMLLVSLVSWIIIRGRSRISQTLDYLSFLPQAIPTVVIALAVMFIYLTLPIPIYGTIWIIALALITKYIAFGSRTMNAGIIQIHAELEEASIMAGASSLTTFRRIVMPLIMPVFASGWVWVFIHAARELSAALMLYSSKSVVISTNIWSIWFQGNAAETSALAVMLILVTGLITFFSRYFFETKT